MIDFHAHVLPGCDHGSDGLETSLKQLSLAKAAGIETLVATPHFYPNKDSLSHFLKRREETYQLLCAHHDGQPKLRVGSETALCGGLDHMKGLDSLCIQGTNLLLIEMPIGYWSQAMEETLVRLQDDSDFQIILAHVDRYDPDLIERLLDYGFLGQLNAESLSCLFPKRHLFRWIDQGSIVALGSDIHGTKTGYSDFSKAVRKYPQRMKTLFDRSEELLNK